MAYPTPQVTNTTAATFIPEIWSDEIIAAYKKNLVMANLVMKMNFKGKKGDVVHIPAPTRGSASLKAASTAVTLIADTESEVQVSINRHLSIHVSLKTSQKHKPCRLCVSSIQLMLVTP